MWIFGKFTLLRFLVKHLSWQYEEKEKIYWQSNLKLELFHSLWSEKLNSHFTTALLLYSLYVLQTIIILRTCHMVKQLKSLSGHNFFMGITKFFFLITPPTICINIALSTSRVLLSSMRFVITLSFSLFHQIRWVFHQLLSCSWPFL